MLRMNSKSHSTIGILTRSDEKDVASFLTGTPKMSHIGYLINGITQELDYMHMCITNCNLDLVDIA